MHEQDRALWNNVARMSGASARTWYHRHLNLTFPEVYKHYCFVVRIPSMTRRTTQPPPKPPDFPPEKAHAALKKQHALLEGFRGRRYREVQNDERTWRQLTESIIAHGFGESSQNVSDFRMAEWSGPHYIDMGEVQLQSNFEKRIESFAAVLKACLGELELMLPDSEIVGTYQVGEEYSFYHDLRIIVGFASRELFVIDNYLDTQIFDVYMENVAASVGVRVLTASASNSLSAVAQKFATRGNFQLRTSADVHDRTVFADERCWVIGQSIKDAAKRSPLT